MMKDKDTKYLNEAAAQVMTAKDSIWQLGNTLRDCMSRLETIQETNPELAVDVEIKQARHTLERYAKGPLHYSPHPFGWPYDPYVLKDYHADAPPNPHEIAVGKKNGKYVECINCKNPYATRNYCDNCGSPMPLEPKPKVDLYEAAKIIRRLLSYADKTAENHPKAVTAAGQSARARAGIWLAQYERENAHTPKVAAPTDSSQNDKEYTPK